MADSKLVDLASGAPAAGTDIIYAVKDPSGTPADAKLALSDVKDYILSLANTWTATQTIDPADNTSALVVSGYSLTGSNAQSLIDLAGTWNTTGTPTAIKLALTNTASNVASKILDITSGAAGTTSVIGAGVGSTTPLTLYTGGNHSAWFSVGTGGLASGPNQLAFSAGNRYQFSVSNSGSAGYCIMTEAGIGFRAANFSANITTWAPDLILYRQGAANLKFGGIDAASPVAQTLSVQSVAAGQTNVAGANLTITGSQGTGTGAGGSIIFQVAPAGSSGTSQNALSTALTIDSTRKSTFGGNIEFSDGSGISSVATNHLGLKTTTVIRAAATNVGFFVSEQNAIGFVPGTTIPTNANTTFDVALYRDAANTLALRNGTNAQAFRVYNTFTASDNFERGNIFWDSNVLKIGTSKGASGGTARALELQTDGTTRLTIETGGNCVFSGSLFVGSGSSFAWSGRARIQSPGTDGLTLLNSNSTGFGTLQFGGTTSSFPALKRSSASLQVRLADDSDFASVQGKLTTETAYTAGAPTATGYIVLYDSTGTAYKVPAEAL